MYATIEEFAALTGATAADLEPEWSPKADFAWRVLEEIDYGLVLVSPRGTLQHANHLARLELARGRFLRIEEGKVQGHAAQQTEELMRGIQLAARGRRQMLSLAHGPETLCIACVPLAQPFEGDSPSVLLMLARQVGTRNLAVTFFARSHRLTPAEESVLRALCDGLHVQEIAAANGVSINTVRTQIRSLRDKTGTNSMRLLVQKVAALPPVVPVSLSSPVRGPETLAA